MKTICQDLRKRKDLRFSVSVIKEGIINHEIAESLIMLADENLKKHFCNRYKRVFCHFIEIGDA